MVELGMEVVDKVTGFRGIAIGRTEYLFGCTRIGVQPKVGKDGTIKDTLWFDEPSIQIIGKKRVVEPSARDVGGPAPSIPKRASAPTR